MYGAESGVRFAAEADIKARISGVCARATMALRLAALVTDRILMIDRPVRGEAEVHGHPAQYRPSGYFANLVSCTGT